jgi:hypothetical protein
MRLQSLALAPLVLAAAALPAAAADLIEPWERGFTDLEVLVSDLGGDGRTTAALAGWGLTDHISLGAAASVAGGSVERAGLVGLFTFPLAGGLETDLCVEAGVSRAEEGAGRADWLLANEWSRPVGRVVPYARLSAFGDGETDGTGRLAGLMIPVGGHLELHLEAFSAVVGDGSRPQALVLGPNFTLTPEIEVLPEIAYVRDDATGESHWQVSVGLVMDPRILR